MERIDSMAKPDYLNPFSLRENKFFGKSGFKIFKALSHAE